MAMSQWRVGMGSEVTPGLAARGERNAVRGIPAVLEDFSLRSK